MPIKDSLTYRPSSQGWAPRVVLLSVLFVCTWVGAQVVPFLLYIARML